MFFQSVFILGCFIFIFNLDSAWHITDNSVYLSNQQVGMGGSLGIVRVLPCLTDKTLDR